MAENEGFGGDHLTGEISFSQLLLADDDGDVAVGLDVDQSLNYSVFSSGKPPQMLCFGNYNQQEADLVYPETTRNQQKSGVTCSDSSSASSSNNGSINTLSKSVVSENAIVQKLLFWQTKSTSFCTGLFSIFLSNSVEKANWLGPGIRSVHQHHNPSCGNRSENI